MQETDSATEPGESAYTKENELDAPGASVLRNAIEIAMSPVTTDPVAHVRPAQFQTPSTSRFEKPPCVTRASGSDEPNAM